MAVQVKSVLGVAAWLAMTAALAAPPVLERSTASPAMSLSSHDIQSLPSRNLDISLLAPNGGTIPIHVRTGADGRLPVRVVSPDTWQADSAFQGGTLFLPDNAFGVIRSPPGPSASDLASMEVLRAPFATQYGQFGAAVNYVSRLTDPFMLLCRGDEGVPTQLYSGDRFRFEVPYTGKVGTKPAMPGFGGRGMATGRPFPFASARSPSWFYREDLLRDLRAGPLGRLPGTGPSVWNPGMFPLPGDSGFNLGIDAGTDPLKTRGTLADLSQKGLFWAFEPDPCWKYYPDAAPVARGSGCTPGNLPFEQKAVRYGDDIKSLLSDPYTGKPVSGAWVLYGPLSPTPFFDPGEQPGDELPPTFTRTGSDGGYRISLSGLSGPFEVRVAQGCESHATVAIADTPGITATGGTTEGTRTGGGSGLSTTTQSGGATTSSAPQDKPSEGEKVCGPDVTDHVLGTLQFMVETFTAWDEDTKDEKCSSLYGLQADGAWEMRHMGPFDSDRGKDPYLYFGRFFPDRCAVPRWPCGATVQFLGVCLDAQIVNYVAWGAMNQLCDNQGIGMLAHLARDRMVNIFRGIKEAISNKSPSSLRIGKGAAYDAQDAMAAVGELFVKEHTGLATRKSLLEELVKIYVRDYPDIAKTEGFDCQLTCGKYASDIGKMDSFDWGFNWGQEWYDRRGAALSKP